MSDQTDHIQSMISKIDRVLRQTRSRQFWTIFSRYKLQRQLLERCRNFLVMQQRPQSVNSLGMSSPNSVQTTTTELQRLQQEIIQPLRSDVVLLGNHRAALQEEIQALMLQKAQLQSECNTYRQALVLGSSDDPQQAVRSSAMDETELARLKSIRDRTDFLLTSLDSSLQLAFGSMQKNVEVYQATLNTGLDRMHHLGYQGEVLFSTLVNRLAQQVGREMMAATTDDRSRSSLNPDSLNQTINSPINNQTDTFLSRRSIEPSVRLSTEPLAISHQLVEPPTVGESHKSIDEFFSESTQSEVTPIDVTTDLSREPQYSSSQLSQNELNETDIVTLDTLFGLPKDILSETSLSDMTLAEIDQLFADVPSF